MLLHDQPSQAGSQLAPRRGPHPTRRHWPTARPTGPVGHTRPCLMSEFCGTSRTRVRWGGVPGPAAARRRGDGDEAQQLVRELQHDEPHEGGAADRGWDPPNPTPHHPTRETTPHHPSGPTPRYRPPRARPGRAQRPAWACRGGRGVRDGLVRFIRRILSLPVTAGGHGERGAHAHKHPEIGQSIARDHLSFFVPGADFLEPTSACVPSAPVAPIRTPPSVCSVRP